MMRHYLREPTPTVVNPLNRYSLCGIPESSLTNTAGPLCRKCVKIQARLDTKAEQMQETAAREAPSR